MPDLKLVVVCGLPGAGKSVLARPLAHTCGLALFELDRIEAPLLWRGISGHAMGWASYEMLTSLAEDNLGIGRAVLLDSVGWTRDIRRRWAELAERNGAAYRPIEVICSDLDLHRSRLESRDRSLRGLPDFGSQRLDTVLDRYEPWDTPRLVLDSAQSADKLVQQAIAYIAAR